MSIPIDNFAGAGQQLSTKAGNHQYPTSFNLYRPSLAHSHTFVLGEHEDKPIYTVTTHQVLSKQPDVVLHSGPNENSPALATYNIKRFSFDRSVELSPLFAGSKLPAENVRRNFRTYSFEAEVDGPMGLKRERFEWRRSRGQDIPGVGARIFGHKLVRLAADAAGTGNRASDGAEVVAVCSGPGSAYTGSKVFKFTFVGSGASGALGERWATMAIITALGGWREDVRRRLFYIYIFVCVM
jgi:hypothetical protein